MKFNSEFSEFIIPVVMDNGKYFINELFNKKFNCDAPKVTNHLLAFYKNQSNCFLPVSYASFMSYKNVILVGGVMTDGDVIRQMSEQEKQIIANSKGIYYSMLKYAFSYFADRCDAYFGYVNNPRALEVNLAAGFEKTEHQYLIANYHKPMSNWKKNKITEMIKNLGAF